MRENIGFIGLGSLGMPVAVNLLQAGYALTVYNRTPEKAQPLVAQGAQQAVRPCSSN
ncbi:NAD(P)-binding domain-containing protein [Paenibacillus shenyangensis]|uniref:NAD(P)-binding domain-containing protein n=1 Tax=Paenibacillus sp. A9 TaxID=1284352 RepID=UPI00038198C3|nr:NAD(P)-binding domain-containing protein [Paenibacillus sp. A9]